MINLPTIQEQFFEFYHQQKGKNDVERYHKAVTVWEEKYGMMRPFKSYSSFKRSQEYYQKKKHEA